MTKCAQNGNGTHVGWGNVRAAIGGQHKWLVNPSWDGPDGKGSSNFTMGLPAQSHSHPIYAQGEYPSHIVTRNYYSEKVMPIWSVQDKLFVISPTSNYMFLGVKVVVPKKNKIWFPFCFFFEPFSQIYRKHLLIRFEGPVKFHILIHINGFGDLSTFSRRVFSFGKHEI